MSSASTTSTSSVPRPPRERLVSLDALRGFDIFLLFCLVVVGAFKNGPMQGFTQNLDFWNAFVNQFEHVPWTGFTLCDLAMPLFIFTAGASIPFSLSRFIGSADRKQTGALWFRIIRRVIVLWFFGMCVQGNLLTLEPGKFKIFSNTLQSIAVGYFFACLAYLYLPKRGRYVLFVLLLAAFWAACSFITVDGCGGGSFDEGTNLAYWVDKHVLGRYMDAAYIAEDGSVAFQDWYQYTWVLSSLTFVATALTGVFAGETLYETREKLKSIPADAIDAPKRRSDAQMQTFIWLVVAGVVCLILGRVWNAVPKGAFGYCPIIKHIWTSSMVLHSSGLSFLALAFFYLLYDMMKTPFLRTFFVVFGANAFAAYILSHILHFNEIAHWVVYGLAQFTGAWQGTVEAVAGTALVWVILWDWRRNGRFFRA